MAGLVTKRLPYSDEDRAWNTGVLWLWLLVGVVIVPAVLAAFAYLAGIFAGQKTEGAVFACLAIGAQLLSVAVVCVLARARSLGVGHTSAFGVAMVAASICLLLPSALAAYLFFSTSAGEAAG